MEKITRQIAILNVTINSKDRMEKQYVEKLLNVINDLNEMHKAKHYCSFLCGKSTTDVKQFNHQNLASFGSGKDDGDEFFWNAVIRQSCLAGLLYKDIETYGLLKITESGRNYIKSLRHSLKRKRLYKEAGESVIKIRRELLLICQYKMLTI